MLDARIYSAKEWRELPRDGECAVSFLFGEAAGPCHGLIHRHHVEPDDPESRTYQACAKHHSKIHAARRKLLDPPKWKRCPHKPGTHRYAAGKEACERWLNRDTLAA